MSVSSRKASGESLSFTRSMRSVLLAGFQLAASVLLAITPVRLH